MSIMGIRRRFARHMKILLWIIIVAFVVGSVILFSFYSGGNPAGRGGAAPNQQADEVIATVGGEKILRSELDATHRAYLEQQASLGSSMWGTSGVPLSAILAIRYQALQDLGNSKALADQAHKQMFEATREEVKMRVDQEVEGFVAQVKQSAEQSHRDPREMFRSVMASKGTVRSRVSEDEFRDWLAQLVESSDRAQIERSILIEKLRASVVAPIRASEADLVANYDEADVRYIAVSFPGLKGRTEEQAKQRAQEASARLKSGTGFEAVSRSVSDVPESPTPQKWLARPMIRARFGEEGEKAVFAMKPGATSAPVRTPSAYVIFKFNATRRQLPADFAKKRAELSKQITAQRQTEAWTKYSEDLLKKVEIKPRSPEATGLLAFAKGKRDEAMTAFDKAIQEPEGMPGEVFASICYNLGEYYVQKKQLEKAEERFDSCLSPQGDIPQGLVIGYPEDIYIALGRIALQRKDTQVALEYFEQADASAVSNLITHVTLMDIYQKMGQKEKAAQERQWLAEYRQEQERAMQEATEQQRAAAGPQTGQPPKPAPTPAPGPSEQRIPLRVPTRPTNSAPEPTR